MRCRSNFCGWVSRRRSTSAGSWASCAPRATTISVPSGSTRCGRRAAAPRIPCRTSSTAPAPTARCTRSEPRWRTSSAPIASPSSSDPRVAARRRKEWWETHFDAYYLLEYEPIFDLERDRREVARLLDLLALPVGARVLDVPCGQGRHVHLLAEAGLDVTGLDYSAHLLKAARKRGTARTLRYVRGDMRTLPDEWSGRFDAVVNLFTSFGFFLDP